MLFAIHCIDAPGALTDRQKHQAAHLEYIAAAPLKRIVTGPLLRSDGEIGGSLLIVDAESLEVMQAFNRDDPFRVNGVWERVDIHPFLLRTWLGKPAESVPGQM